MNYVEVGKSQYMKRILAKIGIDEFVEWISLWKPHGLIILLQIVYQYCLKHFSALIDRKCMPLVANDDSKMAS